MNGCLSFLLCFSSIKTCVSLTDVPGCPSMYHHNEGYPNPPHSSDGNSSSCTSLTFYCENVPYWSPRQSAQMSELDVSSVHLSLSLSGESSAVIG